MISNFYLRTFAALFILFLFGSCEMRDELKGKNTNSSGKQGAFILDLSSKEDFTKAGASSPVSKYVIQILDAQGEIVKEYPSYAALQEETKVVKLPVGTYWVRSASYSGGIEEAALNKPYYLGEKEVTLIPDKVITVEDTCVLHNVLVKVNFGKDFQEAIDENYAVTLTNGAGVLTLNKEKNGTAYFKPASSMTIAVRATTKSGMEIYKSQVLTGKENESLKPEDIFEISLGIKDTVPSIDPTPDNPDVPDNPVNPDTPDGPDTPSYGGIQITINVQMNGQDVNIDIPNPNPDADPTPTPDPTPDPDPQPTPDPDPMPGPSYAKPTIVGEGFDIDKVLLDPTTVKVNIKAEAGVKNLYVTIDSEILSEDVLAMVGLAKSFDLANPGEMEQSLRDLGLLGNSPIKGAGQVPFDVSGFMEILSQLGEPGPHKFHLRVVDMQGNDLSKTLAIKFSI